MKKWWRARGRQNDLVPDPKIVEGVERLSLTLQQRQTMAKENWLAYWMTLLLSPAEVALATTDKPAFASVLKRDKIEIAVSSCHLGMEILMMRDKPVACLRYNQDGSAAPGCFEDLRSSKAGKTAAGRVARRPAALKT